MINPRWLQKILQSLEERYGQPDLVAVSLKAKFVKVPLTNRKILYNLPIRNVCPKREPKNMRNS